ncbi:MAG: recombination mediator RecR [Patescibacteria group bacterium]|nr:recombination mediator RecR [Patescibacteria group bacterium]MDD5567180.1 recombination mediator RecR [Patescibacteria group bacterium]
MSQLPKPIQNLIEEFNKLPGVGPKTSERYAYYLLQQPAAEVQKFVQALSVLRQKIKTCSRCLSFSEADPCLICRNSQRDASLLCVVTHSPQINLFEKTGEYNGLYFVLGGVLNPIEGITPENLNISALLKRVRNARPKIKEVVLALNPDVEGESTSLYLKKILKDLVPKITRLARGLPMGGDLDYADEITLANALKGRN